jgi:trimethylamine:corrinoid methyltransferase-like protein
MLELIGEVGIGGNFLGKRSTLHYLRQGEHFQPRSWCRGSYETWAQCGRSELAVAREEAQRLLREHEVLPLRRETVAALKSILGRADPRADLASMDAALAS